MPFKLGHPHYPGSKGRPPGRQRSARKTVEEILDELGVDPIKEMIKLMPELRPKEQARVYETLSKFVYAQKREIDVQGSIEHKAQVKILLPSNGYELIESDAVPALPIVDVVNEDDENSHE